MSLRYCAWIRYFYNNATVVLIENAIIYRTPETVLRVAHIQYGSFVHILSMLMRCLTVVPLDNGSA